MSYGIPFNWLPVGQQILIQIESNRKLIKYKFFEVMNIQKGICVNFSQCILIPVTHFWMYSLLRGVLIIRNKNTLSCPQILELNKNKSEVFS